jgi:hypothetical protein
MKTKEKIEQLAEQWFLINQYNQDDRIHSHRIPECITTKNLFIKGYTQCQEDMLKILKEEIKRAFIHGQGNAQMMEAGLERDEIEDYIYYRMLTLNKQD